MRAENSKTINATQEYIKIFALYRVQYGDFPNDSSNTYVCLGEGYGPDGCVTNTYGAPMAAQSTTFNNEILKITSSLPAMNNGQKVAGAFYDYGSKKIYYSLSGAGQECASGITSTTYGNVTQCIYTLN